MRQVHGNSVARLDMANLDMARLDVGRSGVLSAGRQQVGAVAAGLLEADAGLATDSDTCVAVLVADCVPIAIGSPEGVRLAVHAGWHGLVKGVIRNAADSARDAGASALVAGIGPCIAPCCYEFGADDLEKVVEGLGFDARAVTRHGRPALDLRAAARDALGSAGVEIVHEDVSCTCCSEGWFSWRCRKDVKRQAVYVWKEEEPTGRVVSAGRA